MLAKFFSAARLSSPSGLIQKKLTDTRVISNAENLMLTTPIYETQDYLSNSIRIEQIKKTSSRGNSKGGVL